MQIEFDRARWQQDSDGHWMALHINSPVLAREIVDKLTPSKQYVAHIKRKGRSKDANAYMWVLCQRIAEAVRGMTKEEVYQRAVKDVGQFDMVPIRGDAVSTFIRHWEAGGIGCQAVDDGESPKLPGYHRVVVYHGSSGYDTREMSVLLDYIVAEAKALGIQTETPEELARMMSEWGGTHG